MMTLAQDYLLLVLDDVKGASAVDSAIIRYALAGAVLLDLALAKRVDLADGADPGDGVKAGRVKVVSTRPTGDPVLDWSLDKLAADKPRKPQAIITAIGGDVRWQVTDQLVDAGILRREDGKILGVFPRAAWPAISTRHESVIRAELRSVLLAGRKPTPRQASLISLLAATEALGHVFPDANKRELRARAKEVADGSWAVGAVRSALDMLTAAIIVASSTS